MKIKKIKKCVLGTFGTILLLSTTSIFANTVTVSCLPNLTGTVINQNGDGSHTITTDAQGFPSPIEARGMGNFDIQMPESKLTVVYRDNDGDGCVLFINPSFLGVNVSTQKLNSKAICEVTKNKLSNDIHFLVNPLN